MMVRKPGTGRFPEQSTRRAGAQDPRGRWYNRSDPSSARVLKVAAMGAAVRSVFGGQAHASTFGTMGLMSVIPFLLAVTMPIHEPLSDAHSRVERIGEPARAVGARLAVEVVDDESGRPLAVRAIVRGSDGAYADGAGRGLYADGRFFADGAFEAPLEPGTAEVRLTCGPEYEPLTFREEMQANRKVTLRARMRRWFDAGARGWYCGDSHVHTQHDATGDIRTDGSFTVLQARAQGLHYLSQATKASREEDPRRLSRPDLIFANAEEQSLGAYIGHFTTLGITSPIVGLEEVLRAPLPAQGCAELAHKHGGILTYTHPLAPPYQLHWMGAAGAMSDAVLRKCADAMDIDSPATEALWFAMLNLGNRIAAGGSTDSTLERRHTLAPGDRRVYAHAPEFTLAAIAGAIRDGRTFATNGGPLFVFLRVGDAEPGATLPAVGKAQTVEIEVRSLRPLRSITLTRSGVPVRTFPADGRSGAVKATWQVEETENAWYVARAEDEAGAWAVTSPVYFAKSGAVDEGFRCALLLEISNCTRMVELRRDFFAHIVATVSPADPLVSAELLRDGTVSEAYRIGEGSRTSGMLPVTGGEGEYTPGHLWHPSPGNAYHFLADCPVRETGWYSVRITTRSGRVMQSDTMRFDAAHPVSSVICVAHLWGPGTLLTRRGYGEEMPLSEISAPFEGDHWWYPRNNFWQVEAAFGGHRSEWSGGDGRRAQASFRRRTEADTEGQ